MTNNLLKLTRIGLDYLQKVANVQDLPSIDDLLDELIVLMKKRELRRYPSAWLDPEIEAVKEILRRTTIREGI